MQLIVLWLPHRKIAHVLRIWTRKIHVHPHQKRGRCWPDNKQTTKGKNQLLEHCRAPFFPTDCTRKSTTFLPHLLIFRQKVSLLNVKLKSAALIEALFIIKVCEDGGQWSQLLRIYVDRSIVFYEKTASQNTSSEMSLQSRLTLSKEWWRFLACRAFVCKFKMNWMHLCVIHGH